MLAEPPKGQANMFDRSRVSAKAQTTRMAPKAMLLNTNSSPKYRKTSRIAGCELTIASASTPLQRSSQNTTTLSATKAESAIVSSTQAPRHRVGSRAVGGSGVAFPRSFNVCALTPAVPHPLSSGFFR